MPLDEIKGRLIRNPNYSNNHVSLNDWCWTPDVSTHRKPQFQEALRESVQREGFRNPVVVYALVEGCFLSFGGSRLRAARDLDFERIPAIVNDYAGRFPDGEEVDEHNYRRFFSDPPSTFSVGNSGACYHYNLERKRRADYDMAGMRWCQGADFIDDEFPWINGSNPTS